jgi:hypothetical protein
MKYCQPQKEIRLEGKYQETVHIFAYFIVSRAKILIVSTVVD